MLNISLEQLLKFTNSKLICGKPESLITRFSTDSRSLICKDFFIPLSGPNFDAHDYIIDAVLKKASGFVFSRRDFKMNSTIEEAIKINPEIIILNNSDPMLFLKGAASGYIRKRKAVSIGITGSSGKTTTKNFLASILKSYAKTIYTEKNYNNEIGVCKSIFNIEEDTDFFIAELGMRGPGQIKELSEICNIKHGIITNVGPSHLEFFKSTKEIAIAKAEIGEKIYKNSGILLLNKDDPHTDYIEKKLECKIIECGSLNTLEYNFTNALCSQYAIYGYDFYHFNNYLTHIDLSIPGYHNIYNSLLAAAFAKTINIDNEVITKALKATFSNDNRMDIFQKGSLLIIDDCYNANPLSLKSAVDTLKEIAQDKGLRSVAIIGDMFELGEESEKLHYDSGEYIANKNIDLLITVGNHCANLNDGYKKIKKGISLSYHFQDINEMLINLDNIISKRDIILVKGSRANKMENIIEFIRKEDFK